MREKMIAAAGVILFVGLIQTVDAPLWAVAALSIGLYECGIMALRIQKGNRNRKKEKAYLTATRLDMRRVEAQVFNPLREMREVS